MSFLLYDLKQQAKKQKKHPCELVPEEDIPICVICGVKIPVGSDLSVKRWLTRKVCPKSRDTKEIACYQALARQQAKDQPDKGNPGVRKSEHYRKPKIEKIPPRVVMSQSEADRLDLEQMKINISVYAKEMQRCGYVTDPGRRLSPEEIESIKHTLTPPSTERRIVENYRPFMPRRSAPL